MMLVRTYVGPSGIHGTGLFAEEFIAKGTLMWKFQPGLDIVVSPKLLEDLPPAAREYLERYAYNSDFFPGGNVLNFDNSRFINHSDSPNTDNESEVAYALRDIKAGEEITCNYHDVCNDFDGVA